MIYLNPTSTNQLNLVCSDMVVIDNPVYLFRFKNDQSEVDQLIELENLLPNNQRADRFNLTLPTDLDLKPGEFRYWVYESPLTGDTDYDNMRILTSGKAIVSTTFETDTTYERTGEDIVYKGNEA